jgi:hypothetical protein
MPLRSNSRSPGHAGKNFFAKRSGSNQSADKFANNNIQASPEVPSNKMKMGARGKKKKKKTSTEKF